MPVRATKRGIERTRLQGECDVLVCGASFAGLTIARELAGSGARVLVIDRYEIGERQTSACGVPTTWLDALQLRGALRQTFGELTVHTPWRSARWRLPWRTCAESPCMPENPIAVAMSGGVDSSTVAALLVRQGRSIVGMTMQLWNQRRLPELSAEGGVGRCCSLDDVYDARRVAEQVGIPYYVVNFERQFEEQVVKPFV
ncbi:MAG: FAD-dependent oxidoreductase, partial [Solirubrobacteraceae bacterium]